MILSVIRFNIVQFFACGVSNPLNNTQKGSSAVIGLFLVNTNG